MLTVLRVKGIAALRWDPRPLGRAGYEVSSEAALRRVALASCRETRRVVSCARRARLADTPVLLEVGERCHVVLDDADVEVVVDHGRCPQRGAYVASSDEHLSCVERAGEPRVQVENE